MLAFNGKKPNSVKTKLDDYFVGSPMTSDNVKYPLLNSSNGVGATFKTWSNSEEINFNLSYTKSFYPKIVYQSDFLLNDIGIPKNIDTIYSKNNKIYKYPSNTFFEVPIEWILADSWMGDIKFKLNNIEYTSYSMFHKKSKSIYLEKIFNNNNYKEFNPNNIYKNFNNNYKDSYDVCINPDMSFIYQRNLGQNNNYYYFGPGSEDIDDYFLLWGGMLYDFGWWYRINQIGVNSLFYPQLQFTPNNNKKFPIWNLSSIVNSILTFNKNVYLQDFGNLINTVAPTIVKLDDYLSLKWGPLNNNFEFNNNPTCARGNTKIYIKASRSPSGINNNNIPFFKLNSREDNSRFYGLYEAAFPPFYGSFEFSTGLYNTLPNLFYDDLGQVKGESSNTTYIIKESQFGICPQVVKSKFINNQYVSTVFTVYIIDITFFENNIPDNKPWWCYTDSYEILYIDFSNWFELEFTGSQKFKSMYNLNDYYTLTEATKKMRDLLKDSRFDKIFKNKNEAIILYPSSLLVYQRFEATAFNKKDAIYNLVNSPGLILREEPKSNPDSNTYDYEYIIRLRPTDQMYVKGSDYQYAHVFPVISNVPAYNEDEYVQFINNSWFVPDELQRGWGNAELNKTIKNTAGSSKFNMTF